MANARNIELNRWLVQGWYADDVLNVVRDYLEEFNVVNCTTALQRLAKAIGGKNERHKGKHAGHQFSRDVAKLLARTTSLIQQQGSRVPAQNLANALWACERLGLADAPEIPALVDAARVAISDSRRLAAFSGQNLANTVWAVAKFGVGDFRMFSEAVEKRVSDLNGQELSMVAWALGASGQVRNGAILAVAEGARQLPYGGVWSLSAQQLSTLAWSLARLACHKNPLLGEIAEAAVERVVAGEFNAQDLANTAWAFGRLEVPAPELLKAICRFVRSKVAVPKAKKNQTRDASFFSPQQLALLCWAAAKLNVKTGGRMVLAIVRVVRQRAAEFTPRDLTDIIWAVAALGVKAPKFVAAAGDTAQKRMSDFNSQELLRFLGAFRRAGGSAAQQSALAAVQRELCYDFSSLPGVKIFLTAETPGGRKGQRNASIGGDPQRADGGTTGVALWEASFVLSEWLARQTKGLAACTEISKVLPKGSWQSWSGKNGVELGAGLGLPSIVTAHLGTRMIATDGDPAVLKLLSSNVVRNAPKGDSSRISSKALLWGVENPLNILGLSKAPDVLLAADVVYASAKEELTEKLISTILELTGPHTVVLMSNVSRFPEGHPKGEGRFFASMERFFDQVVVPQSCLHGDFQKVGVGSCVLRALRRKQAVVANEALAPHLSKKAGSKNKRKKSIAVAEETQSPLPTATQSRKKRRRHEGVSETFVGASDISSMSSGLESHRQKRKLKSARKVKISRLHIRNNRYSQSEHASG